MIFSKRQCALKSLKAFQLSVIFLLCSAAVYKLSAEQNVFPRGTEKIRIQYTDTVFPGDAVFIRIVLNTSSLEKGKADLLTQGKDTVLQRALLYEIPDKQNKTYIAALPLSSWYKEGEPLHIALSYKLKNEQEENLFLPLSVQAKDFVSETIELNARNTAIKTDKSTERTQQIDRLNEVLNTVDYSAVYQTSVFVLPVQSTRRTSGFADRRVYAYTDGKSSVGLHYGIDFGVPEKTPISACGKGKVVLAENRISTGYSVVIEHLPGLYSLYYHLNSYCVQIGDIVEQGQLIGESGSTGLATGPHLHWEVRLLGTAVNPDLFTSSFPVF